MRSSCAVAVAALAWMLVPAARADITVSTDRVVVDTGRARAVVDRAPFRIAFQTGHRRTVLRETARPPRARRIPPTFDPEPFALERAPDHAVYEPLTFEVGREERAQWFGSYWAGDLLFARHRGTMHAARRVETARAEGAGVRLIVATTDPARDLVVRIRPDRSATSLRLTATPTSARGVIAMGDSFATGGDEAFRGFGGRHWGIDQRGHKLYGWIEQENVGGPATLGATALLPGFVEQGTGRTLASLGSPDLAGDFSGGPAHYLFPGGPAALTRCSTSLSRRARTPFCSTALS
jgi:hypothetical protein